MNMAISAFTTLWILSSLFVVGFQCKVPHTWDVINGSCINLVGFWTYFDVMNILTDLALIILPFIICSRLQIAFNRKVTILACFALRIL